MGCRCVSFLNMYYIAPRLRAKACAPENSATCDDTSQISKAVLWMSAAIYVIGFFVAYTPGPILTKLGRN
jgi:mercuric ion transport protein